MKNKLISIACASLLSLAYVQVSSAEDRSQNNQGKQNLRKVCSLRTLKGRYLFSASGKSKGNDFSFAGSERFDGNGTITTKQSVNGSSDIIRITGTYKIASDCTGSSTYSDDTHYNLFVSPDGSIFNFIQTDIGAIISGEEKRIAP
jgi:type II secretory pathway pseudopilin PulG